MLNCDLTAPELRRRPEKGRGFVYMYTFEDGRRYIGQTRSSVKARTLNHSYKHDTLVDRKIGAGHAFTAEVLAEVPLDELDVTEVHYMMEYRTVRPDGYNLLVGAFSAGNMAEPVREAMRRSSGEQWKHITPEAKEKRLRPLIDSKKMRIICLETGDVYASLNDAGRATGVNVAHISDVLKGKRHSAGGLHWSVYSESTAESRTEVLACLREWERECKMRMKRKVVKNLPWNKRMVET